MATAAAAPPDDTSSILYQARLYCSGVYCLNKIYKKIYERKNIRLFYKVDFQNHHTSPCRYCSCIKRFVIFFIAFYFWTIASYSTLYISTFYLKMLHQGQMPSMHSHLHHQSPYSVLMRVGVLSVIFTDHNHNRTNRTTF